jgi:hypothetical protein
MRTQSDQKANGRSRIRHDAAPVRLVARGAVTPVGEAVGETWHATADPSASGDCVRGVRNSISDIRGRK